MNCVVAFATEPIRNANVDAHVHENAHDHLRILDALLGQPCGVFYGLLNVFSFEVWVAGKDLVEGRTVRDLVDDHRDW
jgi:hypothetical protein